MKKAELSVVAGLILVLISGLVLFAVFSGVFKKATLEEAINVCRLSVLTQANTKGIPGASGMKSPLDLDCDKRYVDLYNDRVEIGLAPESTSPQSIIYNGKKIKKFTQLNDYIVNQVVAEEMRTCYFEFGEGKMHVFDNSLDPSIKNTFDKEDVCFVCSEINFKDVKQQSYSGYLDYIKKTYIKNEEMTYYQYFNQPALGNISWSVFFSTIVDDNFKFQKDTKYLVVFGKEDKRWRAVLWNLWTSTASGAMAGAAVSIWGGPTVVIGTIGGAAVGLLTGVAQSTFFSTDYGNNYYVYVTPSNTINGMCDIVAT
jgi:hypothetical protein